MYLKSNIKYKSPIDQVNRKFVPRAVKCKAAAKFGPVETESEGWMGGATLTLGRAGLGTTKRNYFVVRQNASSHVATAADMDRRLDFIDATAGKNHILKDLSQITDVQLKWEQASADFTKTMNGVSAKGYTFYGWVMAVQYAGLKNSHGGQRYDANTFPVSFDA